MCRECPKNPPLDTLAQLHSSTHKHIDSEDDIHLNKSTLADNKRVLNNRAKRKYLSVELSLGLVKATEIKHENILKKVKKEGWTDQNLEDFNENVRARKSYWNMFHCAGELKKVGEEVTAKYCKNRTCLICNSIRTAQNLNTYEPVLEAWGENIYMVTLTVPNCKAAALKSTINGMYKTFVSSKNYLYQQYKRGKGGKFEGIRKLECTYNPIRNDYHPHFHILVRGKEAADNLLEQWLMRTKDLGTNRLAQDVRQANKGAAIELFKYFTKVITSVGGKDGERGIYLDALDHIFKAVKGKRTFQTFGFKISDYVEKKEEQKEEEEEANQETDEVPEVFHWDRDNTNWISKTTGEILTTYVLSQTLIDITKKMILPKNNAYLAMKSKKKPPH